MSVHCHQFTWDNIFYRGSQRTKFDMLDLLNLNETTVVFKILKYKMSTCLNVLCVDKSFTWAAVIVSDFNFVRQFNIKYWSLYTTMSHYNYFLCNIYIEVYFCTKLHSLCVELSCSAIVPINNMLQCHWSLSSNYSRNLAVSSCVEFSTSLLLPAQCSSGSQLFWLQGPSLSKTIFKGPFSQADVYLWYFSCNDNKCI